MSEQGDVSQILHEDQYEMLAARVSGGFAPSGEAHRFAWFSPSQLPARDLFGFGQDAVLDASAAALGLKLRYRA